jgi:hypothetical protein
LVFFFAAITLFPLEPGTETRVMDYVSNSRKPMATRKKKSVKILAKKALAKYRAMRDFTKTAEPSGAKAVAGAKALRFVIQKHEATRLHYDFRLEINGTFRS